MTTTKTKKKTVKRTIKSPGVYHDANGTYYLKYKNKTYRGFKSVEDAEIKRAMLKLSKDSLKHEKFGAIISEFLDDQRAKYESQEISFGTYDKKRSIIKLYIHDELSMYRMDKLTPKIARDFRNSLIPIELSTTQKNFILRILKSIIKYAKQFYDFNDNLSIHLDNFPKTDLERKKDKNKLNYIWTNDDFEQFISDMDLNFKLIYTLMFKHGMRLGEAQAIRYCDVDFKNKEIDINGSITRKTDKGLYERKSTKTKSSDRIIYIGKTIKYFELLQRQNSELYGYNDKWYVCGDKDPLYFRKVHRMKDKHVIEKNLVSCTNHEMRHMFVSNAWSAGIPISAISIYIGHRNISTTLEVYSHLTKEDNNKMKNYIENI